MRDMLEKLCIDALSSFYIDGDIDFIDALDDNVLWFGPVESQFLRGKEAVSTYFHELTKKFRFSTENLRATLMPLKSEACTILIDLELFGYRNDGRVINYSQHIIVDLCRKKDNLGNVVWKVPFIHISNVIKRRSKTQKEASHESKAQMQKFISDRNNINKISFLTDSGSTVFIAEDSIVYIEGGKGVKSYIHLKEDCILVNHLLKDIIQKLPDYYYRCHASYIVNLKNVKSIGGYKITLFTGEEIPVPAKKYTEVKKHITEYLEAQT